MKIYSFHVKIVNNNITFKSETHKEMFKRFLGQWNDREVGLEIIEKKSKRSDQQNRYYWGAYLPILSSETGHTKDELHELFKAKFLTKKISEVMSQKVRITKSTTELSKGEFSDFIANISEFTQIEPPDTTEYFGYSYHK